MPATIPVTIDVEAEAAAVLEDPRTRAVVGRLVSRMLSRPPGPGELAQAIAAAKAEARNAGLTDIDIDVELDAYNAERRGSRAA